MKRKLSMSVKRRLKQLIAAVLLAVGAQILERHYPEDMWSIILRFALYIAVFFLLMLLLKPIHDQQDPDEEEENVPDSGTK